jgi:hypothetical protein
LPPLISIPELEEKIGMEGREQKEEEVVVEALW